MLPIDSVNAEKRYLENPLKDANLFNYCLYCYAVRQDFDRYSTPSNHAYPTLPYPNGGCYRARLLFAESLDRMAFKGPDIPFVLYSYAIFGAASHILFLTLDLT